MSKRALESPEDLIKRAEERLRLALDSVADGSYDWNVQTGEMFYSDRWYESLGYTRSEFRDVTDLVHPEDAEIVSSAVEAHLKQQTAELDLEFRMRAKSGEYRWTHGRGRVIERDDDGEPLRVVGTNRDISLAKRMQEHLDELENRSRAIVETAGCIIIVLDVAYAIQEWNPAAERIYGWSKQEVLGRNYIEWFLPERLQEGARSTIDNIIANGGTSENFENPIITRDGSERDVLWNAAALVTAQGRRWACAAVGQDVTLRNRANRQRSIAEHEKELLQEKVDAFARPAKLCSSCHAVLAEGAQQWESLQAFLSGQGKILLEESRCPDCEEIASAD